MQTPTRSTQQDLVEAELFLPWSAQQLCGEIYASYQVLEERADGEGDFFRVRGEPNTVKRFSEQFEHAVRVPQPPDHLNST